MFHLSRFSLETDNIEIHSGDHSDAQIQKCQIDRPSLQSEHQEISHPQKCEIGGPSIQSGHHENVATASSGDSFVKGAPTIIESPSFEGIIESPSDTKETLNVHIKG